MQKLDEFMQATHCGSHAWHMYEIDALINWPTGQVVLHVREFLSL